MLEPNDPCPCQSGRKYKKCHGGPGGGLPEQRTARDGFDPYAKIFTAAGGVDPDYVRKRVPVLVDLLRRHVPCFDLRVPEERLSRELLAEGGLEVRGAKDQEAFEAALHEFSIAHIGDLCDAELWETCIRRFTEVAGDVALTRRERVGAAIGVALLSGLPDEAGIRGRVVLDLVFRVSLEEMHAYELLRQQSREKEGGSTPEDMEAFWGQYPAIRHRYEERYRREVGVVVESIYHGQVPEAVSIDVALRGTETLMRATRDARASGVQIGPDELHAMLRPPFEQDMLDGGVEAIVRRWQEAARAEQPDLNKAELRAHRRRIGSAVRLVQDGGPGADVVLFSAYVRAITRGQFYVTDKDEAAEARKCFGEHTLEPDGVLVYADYLASRDEPGTVRRLVIAALEMWPDHEGIRTAAERLGEAEMAEARAARQGPLLDEE